MKRFPLFAIVTFMLLCLWASWSPTYGQNATTHFQSTGLREAFYLQPNFLLIASGNNVNNEAQIGRLNLTTMAYESINDSMPVLFTEVLPLRNDTGIAIGNGAAYFTTDAWQSFQAYPANTFSGTFGNARSNLVATQNGYVASTSTGNLYYSPNGVQWQNVAVSGLVGPATLRQLRHYDGITYYFHTASNYAVSTDGGQTFTTINASRAVTLTQFYPLENAHLLAWGTTTSGSPINWQYSLDTGKTFTPLQLSRRIWYAERIDSLYAIANDTLWLSQDTAATFTVLNPALGAGNAISLAPFSNASPLLRSVTGFATNIAGPWQTGLQYAGQNRVVHFSGNTGLLAGTNNSGYSITQNGGRTFDVKIPQPSIPVNNEIEAAFVQNDSVFFMADSDGDVFKTTNAGRSWQRKLNITGTTTQARRFYSTHPDTVLYTSFDFRARISRNGGESWQSASNFFNLWPYCMAPDGRIYGAHVSSQDSNKIKVYQFNASDNLAVPAVTNTFNQSQYEVITIEMFDAQLGFLLAIDAQRNLHLYKTNNAWSTQQYLGPILNLTTEPLLQRIRYELHITSADTLYLQRLSLVDEDYNRNEIYASFNQGSSWQTVAISPSPFPNTDKLVDVHFFSPQSFISVWTSGRILYNALGNLGGGTTNVRSVELHLKLLPYPNPTSHTISVNLAETPDLLEVYTLSGRLVKREVQTSTLYIADLAAGQYLLMATQGGKKGAALFMKVED